MRNPSHFRPKQHTIFSRDLCRAGAISVIRTRDTSERSCPSSHHYGPGAGTREEHDAPSGGNILGWPSSSRKAEGDARGELQRSSRRLGWPVDAKKFDCVAKKISRWGLAASDSAICIVELWSSRAAHMFSVGGGGIWRLLLSSRVNHRWGRDDTQNRLKGVPFQAARRS